MLEISVSIVHWRSSELLTLSSLIIIVIEIGRCVCVFGRNQYAYTLRVGIRIAKFD